MSDSERLKKKLVTAFKLYGFNVRSELAILIIECLATYDIDLNKNFDRYVKNICEYLEKHVDVEKCIERESIVKALEACIHTGTDDHETRFSVIDAFNFPRLKYDIARKHYYIDTKTKPNIIGQAEHKNELFQARYLNVLQRSDRCFKQKNHQRDADNQFNLCTIDSLLTASEQYLERNFILGSLFQSSNGKYYIEDPTGMIELDLRHAKYHVGFYYENSFVLVNGVYSDRILQVSTMMLPPAEEFKDSKSMFIQINYFGGKSEYLLRDSEKLDELMTDDDDRAMIFISDLWLDKELVYEKLEKMFEGYNNFPPIAFVFLGNFLSHCYDTETCEILAKSFKRLAEIIKKYYEIHKYSYFVFVPGLSDPCLPHILPRPSLPKIITKDFQKIVPRSVFTTNPCRIQYCTREIVVYRNDLLAKLMQDSLNKPTKNKVNDFVTRTVLSQAHLSPFSLNSQPVHWHFDYTLHLYPLPNLVVVGDKCNPYEGKYKGCTLINPGCFIESGFSFKSYIPLSDTVEDCSL